MRILHVMKIVGIAGAENYLIHALPALQKEGIEITFLSLTPNKQKGSESEFLNQLKDEGIQSEVLYYTTFGLSTQRKVRTIIKEGNYDLIHTHLIHADFLLALTRKLSTRKFRLISTKHGHDEKYMNSYGFNPAGKKTLTYHYAAKLAEKEIYRSYAISEGLRKLFIAHKISPTDQIDTIPYGFDFHNENVTVDPSIRFADHQLLLVGRFTELKGHLDAISALKLLRPKFESLKLVFVGSGYFEKEVKNFVRNQGLENLVIFKGYQPNSIQYMASSDVVLIPSKAEGFGLVLLEAYSVKKPVVIYDVPALNEHVINGKTGLIARPYLIEDLSDKIECLLRDKVRSHEMGESGYRLLKSNYTLKTMVTKTIDFYRKSLS
ncbi:MAG: glycosyltransferase family 4 protein [Crocinitomicaceae bacterium]